MMRVRSWVLVQAALFLFSVSADSLDNPATPAAPALPLEAIIQRIQQHNSRQSTELERYVATRHYEVQYRGYATSIAAEMVVEVQFDRASGKTFRILSQNGSKLLCDKVLKKAIESEKEAAHDQNSTALSPANYRFQLAGTDVLNGRPAYVLHVDPLQPGKFLYRGKVWVDAADYAVARIDVEPAKNPSIWISRSRVENTYAPTDGMWLPQKNRSESKIRIGGTAVLTIDYGTYQVVLAGDHADASRLLLPDSSLREAAF